MSLKYNDNIKASKKCDEKESDWSKIIKIWESNKGYNEENEK